MSGRYHSWVADAKSIVNLELDRSLMSGSVLKVSDLVKPILVARNTPVKLMLNVSNGVISTKGLALEDGSKGEFIKVKNLVSNKILRAKVLNERHVIVGSYL